MHNGKGPREPFAAHHGRRYFSSSLLLGASPCFQGAATNLRVDARGNIVIRPLEAFQPPDTSAAFLVALLVAGGTRARWGRHRYLINTIRSRLHSDPTARLST